MPRHGAAAINSADQIVKFERDREREESARGTAAAGVWNEGFIAVQEQTLPLEWLGSSLSADRTITTWQGGLTSPRRTPPVPPSDGYLIIRDTPERWTISTPTSDIASVLSSLLPPFRRPSLYLSPVGSVHDLIPGKGSRCPHPRHRNNNTRPTCLFLY